MSEAAHISVRTYVVVFLSLLLLLVATVAVGYVDLGGNWNLVVALLVASIKATLILLFFMHVKVGTRWIWLFFGLSLYMLAAGALLMFADYMTRQ